MLINNEEDVLDVEFDINRQNQILKAQLMHQQQELIMAWDEIQKARIRMLEYQKKTISDGLDSDDGSNGFRIFSIPFWLNFYIFQKFFYYYYMVSISFL